MPVTDRQSRDQALFNAADSYVIKEFTPALSTARRHRLFQTVGQIELFPENSILELGCGAGFAARYLEGRYRHYVGVDYSEKLIEFARRYNAMPAAKYFVGNVTELSFSQKFDCAFMIGVLHHVAEPIKALWTTRQMLKPGGFLAVNEPSRHNPLFQASRVIRTVANKDYSDEQIQYRASELESQLYEAGFVDCRLMGQGLLSTPFAEVPMPLQPIMLPLSKAACAFDRLLERTMPGVVRLTAWNLIAVGRNPPVCKSASS